MFLINEIHEWYMKFKRRFDESDDEHPSGSERGSETVENHENEPLTNQNRSPKSKSRRQDKISDTQQPSQQEIEIKYDSNIIYNECNIEQHNKSTDQVHGDNLLQPTSAIEKPEQYSAAPSPLNENTHQPSQSGMNIQAEHSSFHNCNFGANDVSNVVKLLGANLTQPTPAIGQYSDAPSSPSSQNILEWVPSTIETAHTLKDRAVIGGYDIDQSNLWIIRVELCGELILGKLNTKHELAFAAYKKDDTYAEMNVKEFDVCCYKTPEAREKIRWIRSSKGQVPLNAFVAGWKTNAEKLYVGRARYDADNYPGYHTLCPGMIRPNLGALCITYNYSMHTISPYDVLCFEQDEYH